MIFAALIVVLFSCREKDSINDIHAVSGPQATIDWQECVLFSDHDLTICFIGAKESRCPCDVDCLWEGSVDATFHVTGPKGVDTTFTLTTNSNPVNLPHTARVGDKVITFVNTDAVSCADYKQYEKYKVIVTVQ